MAVITGAGSGIGKATAVLLAKRGCHLALCDKDKTGLRQTSELTVSFGVQVISSQLDVSNRTSLFEFAHLVRNDFESINFLINSAGVTIAAKPFIEITDEEWHWIININLWGTIYGIQAFLPLMAKNTSSTIVNMSSMLGLVGMTNQTAYSTSKFAIRGLSESLRMELTEAGINCITILPGAVSTNFIENSWAPKENKLLIKSYIEKIGAVSADEVALKIIDAIQWKKGRVVIGKGAKGIDLLSRWMPTQYTKIILSQIRKKLL